VFLSTACVVGDTPARQADTPLARLVEHFQDPVEGMGIDQVGLGADLDGRSSRTKGHDVMGLPQVMAALRAAVVTNLL
jgi:microsomal dipeptidase-like Zn-dependent dipeptidase